MHARIILYFLLFLLLMGQSVVLSQSVDWQGQLSAWTVLSGNSDNKTQIGARYIPNLFYAKSIKNNISMDVEMSLNAYRFGRFKTIDNFNSNGKIKPYRLWIRFASSQFEARIGLQKINFGSAQFIRPLMWFDLIDPRDPLQITDGVYGLLFRYYFLNNSNIWLWGLYGNDNRKGWEFYPSVKDSPEFGGRFQFPFFSGEAAFSFHHRKVDLGNFIVAPMIPVEDKIPENRFAVDGKWDIGIGLWFEGVIQHQKSDLLLFNWRRSLNLGMDYTFNLGSGLNASTECFILESSQKITGSGEGIKFSVLSMNYPLGLLDRINTIIYYDWDNENLYRFISWQRVYDNWTIHLFGFWNPKVYQIYQNLEDTNLFTGKGFQIMVVFNY